MQIVTYPQRRRQRLRQIFSVNTAVIIAAAGYGYYMGNRLPGALADSLSAGVTVSAIVYAVGFGLTQRVRGSVSASELLNRDREIIRYGISVLQRAVAVTVIVLAYIGLSGKLSTDSFVAPLFAAASASSLAWLLCGIPRVFLRHVHNLTGRDDEEPDFGGMWKSPRLLRREAIENLKQTADGWRASNLNPFAAQDAGPIFVARELAIRYGTLQAEACLHYTQLCDCPEQAEAADCVHRIRFCLDEMKQLRSLEREMRTMLSNDPQSRRMLIRQ